MVSCMPLNSGLEAEMGMKCFTFQIHHPILGLYLAPCSADSHALGILASNLGHLEQCDLPDDPNGEMEIIIIPA